MSLKLSGITMFKLIPLKKLIPVLLYRIIEPVRYNICKYAYRCVVFSGCPVFISCILCCFGISWWQLSSIRFCSCKQLHSCIYVSNTIKTIGSTRWISMASILGSVVSSHFGWVGAYECYIFPGKVSPTTCTVTLNCSSKLLYQKINIGEKAFASTKVGQIVCPHCSRLTIMVVHSPTERGSTPTECWGLGSPRKKTTLPSIHEGQWVACNGTNENISASLCYWRASSKLGYAYAWSLTHV